MNAEDGGKRKFIMIECEEYADSITAERVRRVIKGVTGAKDNWLVEGYGGTFSYYELGDPIVMKPILQENALPSYEEMARYIFWISTHSEFRPEEMDEEKMLIGRTDDTEVYMMYKPDISYLRNHALTLDEADKLPPYTGKRRLFFAPQKYITDEHLRERRIEFVRLPYEMYKLKEG